MGNMSYCRFENTSNDLYDCKEQLEKYGLTGEDEYDEMLSEREFNKAIELIEMCREIAEMYEDVDLDEVTSEFYEKYRKL